MDTLAGMKSILVASRSQKFCILPSKKPHILRTHNSNSIVPNNDMTFNITRHRSSSKDPVSTTALTSISKRGRLLPSLWGRELPARIPKAYDLTRTLDPRLNPSARKCSTHHKRGVRLLASARRSTLHQTAPPKRRDRGRRASFVSLLVFEGDGMKGMKEQRAFAKMGRDTLS